MGTVLNSIPAEWVPENRGDTDDTTNITPVEVTPPIQAPAATPYIFPQNIKSQVTVEPPDTGTISTFNDRNITFGEHSLSIDEVYRDIKRLTLSKNPLDLIFKANEIREKFAFFINSLAGFISKSFSLEDETFSYELYHDADYHRVWMDLISPFLRDRHYITDRLDTVTYFLKQEDGLSQELPIDIGLLVEHADNNVLTEEDFSMVQKVVKIIVELYRGSETISKRVALLDFAKKSANFEATDLHDLSRKSFQKAIQEIHTIIEHYPYEKDSFTQAIQDIIEKYHFCTQDREEIEIYTFKKMIDIHYPSTRHIFFDTNLPSAQKKCFLTKFEWLKIKGYRDLSIDTIGTGKGEQMTAKQNQDYFRHILNCKNLILELESSILSPILLPIILKLAASSMTLNKKEFDKFSYILLFLFATSYENEYIPLSKFLNELEVYINYNNSRRGLERLKIGFSLIVLFVMFVVLGYFLLPPFVFIGGIVFTGIYLKMYFIDDHTNSASIQYNLWVRLWAVTILGVFGYVWLTNIGAYTDYYSGLQKKFSGFGNRIVAEMIPPEKIAEWVKYGASSLLEWNSQK